MSVEKTLIIAEKPSVAADLVKVLPDKFKKEKTHYEGKDYIVSYAVGHLVTLCEPAEMDENFKSWKMNVLPILPKAFLLKPIASSKTQLSALSKLIKKRDVKTIVNACDAGREGELIFRYIMEYVYGGKDSKKELKRLWLQSMTADSIKKAFERLRDDEEMASLASAASCRSEADWLIGINASRGLTAYNSKDGGFFLTPSGRVQTPTLSLIVKREQERQAFEPRNFYKIYQNFENSGKSYQGTWFSPDFEKGKSETQPSADRLWDKNTADEILAKVKDQPAEVEETTKPTTKSCPPLYDLTTLQREANSRFGYSAKRTLGLAQSLYERYKVLTYPRTDSRYLPEDYVKETAGTMKRLEGSSYKTQIQKVLNNNWIKPNKKIFNNSKISDHHAIIPTGLVSKELPEAEKKIFEMVLQRYLAVFFPVAEYMHTVRISKVAEEHFKTEGKVLVQPGWLEVYGKTTQEELLEPIDIKKPTQSTEGIVEEGITTPPARYTESTLLSAMEGAGKFVDDEELAEALKERGLGTPATRAAIIEKLITDKYLVREGKELMPTRKAQDLMNLITAMEIEDLSSPELTGNWENKLSLVEKGKVSKEQFMEEIKDLSVKIVNQIKNFDEDAHRVPASFGPIDGKNFFEYPNHYSSEDGEIRIRKILGGRNMSPDEIIKLLTDKFIGPLEGFISKKGIPFAASIELKENKVGFVFDNPEDDEQMDFSEMTPIGNSFIDNSPVYDTPTAYISQSSADKEKTGLRLNKSILGKTISVDDAKKLIAGEKTDLIKGFRSSKTKRLFDAFLQLDKKGKMSFSFPPREFKGRGKAKPKVEKSEEE